jgi:O-succinylbenzoic acid--CoA ligase
VETTRLTSSEYWESDSIDLRLNPRREIDAVGLDPFLRDDVGIQSSVVLATSGSSGGFKFVVLSKSALLNSARAVIEHSGLGRDDMSLAGLSGFHVGGLGIYARAFLSGSEIVEMDSAGWKRDGSDLVRVLEEKSVTLTSMTPTHLHDLVSHKAQCPDALRLVFLGGGRMDAALIEKARELGWPIRVSYGMTEAGSQIATARDDSVDLLPVLPHWETKVDIDGRLAIRGEALFSGYAIREGAQWKFEDARDGGGWFVTGDRCELQDGMLRFSGRADDLVKISGELVSLSEVNRLAESVAREMGSDAAAIALPDDRRENELVVVMKACERDASDLLCDLNSQLDGIEAVRRVVFVDQLPRTEIGKLDRVRLEQMATEG